jgi:predicted HicB family RNase H-like nuclease
MDVIFIRPDDASLKKKLEKEARARRQSLNAYVLTLLETHPDRKKKK